ncbi:PREDICTED: uncharacterized protein LOC104610406 isoform X1 [Nelumbo nucifera]|uniref:Uncharacterized protein LOC104610406 isoform X1 n=1 Tax=Nelumbo nucifera TaxID=4432 RepID=A0A1U8B3G0_NELNU|nr:PREDICTED: uncharacterized protein LOC104610406 isoform X1 [Nelumbo nucifera]
MAAGTACLITSINAEAAPSNGVPRNQNPLPRLSFSRPSWVVRTESNVRKEEKNKPYPPCVVCRGSGRVKCCHCQGRGLEVIPYPIIHYFLPDLGLAVGMVLVVASVAWGPEFRNIMRLHSMKKWKLREPSGRRPTVKYLLLGSTPASK